MAFKKLTDEERTKHIAELEKFFAEKAERAAAPALRMEPGEMFAGEVVQIAKRSSEYIREGDGTYPVVTLKGADGKLVTLHAFHTLIKDRLKELRPQVGTMLFVQYAGEMTKNKATDKEREEGRDKYHMYIIDTEESLAAGAVADAEFSW